MWLQVQWFASNWWLPSCNQKVISHFLHQLCTETIWTSVANEIIQATWWCSLKLKVKQINDSISNKWTILFPINGVLHACLGFSLLFSFQLYLQFLLTASPVMDDACLSILQKLFVCRTFFRLSWVVVGHPFPIFFLVSSCPVFWKSFFLISLILSSLVPHLSPLTLLVLCYWLLCSVLCPRIPNFKSNANS